MLVKRFLANSEEYVIGFPVKKSLISSWYSQASEV